jgi:predicted DNA-binding protein
MAVGAVAPVVDPLHKEMKMETEVVSMRLPKASLKRLRNLAHEVSLERGQDTTWPAVVREIIEAHLQKREIIEAHLQNVESAKKGG